MANVDNPHGYPIVGSLDGRPAYTRNYAKASGDGDAIGFNDLVDLVAAGTDVERIGAGGPFLGVSHSFGAASTATTHLIGILTPASICEAQTDLSLVTADTGLIANAMTDVAPNTTTNISAQEIDSATEVVTGTLDFRLLRLAPYVGNASGTNSRWFVLCNDVRISDLKAGI
jgi:hypothetical protein